MCPRSDRSLLGSSALKMLEPRCFWAFLGIRVSGLAQAEHSLGCVWMFHHRESKCGGSSVSLGFDTTLRRLTGPWGFLVAGIKRKIRSLNFSSADIIAKRDSFSAPLCVDHDTLAFVGVCL